MSVWTAFSRRHPRRLRGRGRYEDRVLQPDTEYLIFGEIVTREGRNLTQERNAELMAKRMQTVPLERALKIGSGAHTVIEITDPIAPSAAGPRSISGREMT